MTSKLILGCIFEGDYSMNLKRSHMGSGRVSMCFRELLMRLFNPGISGDLVPDDHSSWIHMYVRTCGGLDNIRFRYFMYVHSGNPVSILKGLKIAPQTDLSIGANRNVPWSHGHKVTS